MEAIAEFTRAVELTPNEVDYAATLAWARFCAASDKQSLAAATREVLTRAIRKSQMPEIARFYLGRVERMLGRDREALRHFQEVLEVQPKHADAAAEVRVIEARLASAPKGGGLLGRKR
ncbi:MAG: tetratricopeptide repeat protein [Kofleriaceae bacterium]